MTTTQLILDGQVVAGLVKVTCACCATPQVLVPARELDATRMLCPVTRSTYLDRGDGAYQPDGGTAPTATPLPHAGATSSTGPEVEVLSDRPRVTGPKTRISLERATFAADH
jgi:hypothetical protein